MTHTLEHSHTERSRRVCATWVACAQVALMVGVGQIFGLSRVQSARAGLLLAAGGEFAFVAL